MKSSTTGQKVFVVVTGVALIAAAYYSTPRAHYDGTVEDSVLYQRAGNVKPVPSGHTPL